MPISNGSLSKTQHIPVKKKQKSLSPSSSLRQKNIILSSIDSKIRILIITESFHPYTSGIARRFKEIIERLVKRNFLIHVITGCKVYIKYNIQNFFKSLLIINNSDSRVVNNGLIKKKFHNL